ncbi:MAG: hypothetical protein EBT09_09075, partial [Actinobacteria bacterium]|nr:hypothetical protein [Actinomycetota bacterium]
LFLALGLPSDWGLFDDRIWIFCLGWVSEFRVNEEVVFFDIEVERVFVETLGIKIWIGKDLALEFPLIHHFVIGHSHFPFQQSRRE